MDTMYVTNSFHTLFQDIGNHITKDASPSDYLTEIIKNPEFKQYPFSLLYQLQFTEQSPVYHPEGTVWNHTLLVVDEAAKRKNQSKNPSVFMWAALLHDIGKPSTTKNRHGKITAYNHDQIGAKLAREFLSLFTSEKLFIDHVCALIQYHMQILYVVKNMQYADIKGMLKQVDIQDIALLGLCDRLGRTGVSLKEEENNIKLFIDKCEALERKLSLWQKQV
jgi:putative nucleotidyltransferase with HDIG domain